MSDSHTFEDRLLDNLRRVVAQNPAPGVAAHPRRPPRTRLALAGMAAAGTAVAVIVATTGNTTPSAYALQSKPGGAVTVSIRSLRDAAGLEGSLRAAGIPAVVDYVPAAKAGCAPPGLGALPPKGAGPTTEQGLQLHPKGAKGDTGPTLTRHGSVKGLGTHGAIGVGQPGPMSRISVGPKGASFTIDPGNIRPGQRIYITTSTGALTSISMAIATKKPSPLCATNPPTP